MDLVGAIEWVVGRIEVTISAVYARLVVEFGASVVGISAPQRRYAPLFSGLAYWPIHT